MPALDRDAAVAKACDLVAKAAGESASLVAFPEAFVAGYPDGVWRAPAWTPRGGSGKKPLVRATYSA